MQQKVFISCSSKDRKIALTICNAVEARGQKCWMSSRDVLPGENFQGAIVRAIRSAGVMVFVFSANANNSDEIKKEIALAGQNKLMVIPVRVEDVVPSEDFSYELATRQWVDLFDDWEYAIEQLIRQIDHVIPPKIPEAPVKTRPPDPAPVDPPAVLAEAGGEPEPLILDKEIAAPAPQSPPPSETDAGPGQETATPSLAGRLRSRLTSRALIVGACLLAACAAIFLGWHSHWWPGAGKPGAAPGVASSAGNEIIEPFKQDSSKPYPYQELDRNAAVALLDNATLALGKFTVTDKFFGAFAESREHIEQGYSSIGEADKAQEQAHIIVAMARNAAPGDWFRNGTKIYKLATAAKVFLDSGNAQEARAPLQDARKIWDDSIVAPDPTGNEWIYGKQLISVYVAMHDMKSAAEIFDWLEQAIEHGKGLSWSSGDGIVRAVLGFRIRSPVGQLVRDGNADAAFALAQTLHDPDIRIVALTEILRDLPKNDGCSVAPKLGPVLRQLIAQRGNDNNNLFSLADGASWCGLKGLTESTIQTLLAAKPDHGFVELAADAARVGDSALANKLLAHPPQASGTENCGNINMYTPMGEAIGRIPAYVALDDMDQAEHAADIALGKIKGLDGQAVKLSCTALVAETLAEAELWDKASAVALQTYQATKGYDLSQNSADALRVVRILGASGHFAQGKEIIAAIKDVDSANTARLALAVCAAQWGNRREASDLLNAIGPGKTDYYATSADMARVYDGATLNY